MSARHRGAADTCAKSCLAKFRMAAVKRELSTYLDAVRAAAALTVFVGHYSLQHLSGGMLWQLRAYSDQAVSVFFVLSGFVIAHAASSRPTSGRQFCIERAARIGSVAVPALGLTVVLDAIGSHLFPANYVIGQWGFEGGHTLAGLFAGLLCVHEVWELHVLQGSNFPYWSLGYEAPFYAMFGIAAFARGWWRAAGLVVCAAIVGPSILTLLPLWCVGVALYHLCKRVEVSAGCGFALAAAGIAVWAAFELAAWKYGRPGNATGALMKRATLLQDYVVGAAFALHVLGVNAAAPILARVMTALAGPARWLAGRSFSLYVIHYPVLTFLFACMPWPNTDARSRTFAFVGTLVCVAAFAACTEQKKMAWRKGVEALLARGRWR